MGARKGVGLLVTCIAVILYSVPRLPAQAPAATITGMNPQTGVVTAKVNSTGQVFEFVLTDRALLRRVHAGQGVFVNLGNKQVSLDGKQAQGSIVNLLPLGRPASASTGSTAASGSGSPGTSTPPPAPVTASCGGTANPLTSDTCGKTPGAATVTGYAASCGAAAAISGNVFPAGSSDWLTFTVPAPRAQCANPMIQVSIASNPVGRIAFDALASAGGPALPDGFGAGETPFAAGVDSTTHLGGSAAPIPPGVYYIRVHGVDATVVGTWTIHITG